MRWQVLYLVAMIIMSILFVVDIYVTQRSAATEEDILRLLLDRYGMTIEQSEIDSEQSLWNWKLEVWRGGPLPPTLVAFSNVDSDGSVKKSEFTMHELGERGVSVGFSHEHELLGYRMRGARHIWTDPNSDEYHEYIDFLFDGTFDFYRTASSAYIFYQNTRYEIVPFPEGDSRTDLAIQLDGMITPVEFHEGAWRKME